MSRNEIREQRRSMNGTRLSSASSAFLPRLPPESAIAAPPMVLDLQLVAVRNDEVEDRDGRLVDVVDQVLRLALERRIGDERRDRDHQTEGGAVHRFCDAV